MFVYTPDMPIADTNRNANRPIQHGRNGVKVTAFNGSPRMDGNTAHMIRHVFTALEQEGIEGVLAACVRCHNCMTVCPICYCKTCLFKSPTFDHEPMQYMNWAQRKGAYRLPADTTLFHLTRLNHMVLSCVGCGMCTSDCPAELPVGLVFRAIGQEVQEAFDYVPGRSVEDPLPMITFREDEWMEVGEE